MNHLMQASETHNTHHIGMIARWRPVHLGHSPVLRGLCRAGGRVKIGIGSANRYNLRNPFTLQETVDMLEIALRGHRNYELIPIDDLDDGPRWREMILNRFGALDLFVTENPYVQDLMCSDYGVVHPVKFVKPCEKIQLNGTMVRLAMARGEPWEALVEPAIADYIKSNRLDVRFRREFGLEALSKG